MHRATKYYSGDVARARRTMPNWISANTHQNHEEREED